MIALFQANLREAASSLLAARQRSLLALIGISIGVGSVIAMISVGVIVKDEALTHFRELGTDVLSVRIRRAPPRVAALVTPGDALRLAALPTIAAAATFMTEHGQLSLAGRATTDVTMIGATPALADLDKLRVSAGRHISDLDRRRYFCVVGAKVAAAMRDAGFGRIVGETVRMGAAVYTVLGVLRRVPRGARHYDADRSVIVPISTARRTFLRPDIRNITARMSPGAHHVSATRDVLDYFRRKSADLRVQVRSAEQLIQQMYKQMRLFTLLLGSLGSISLLVGGIGVMNVMLVSVTERRSEIGIRRALGARRADIQSQFLIESVMLSLAGGLVGIAAGMGGTYGICVYAGWTFAISMPAMGLGMAVATASGMFFGFYPAWQAARLDPVAALRGA